MKGRGLISGRSAMILNQPEGAIDTIMGVRFITKQTFNYDDEFAVVAYDASSLNGVAMSLKEQYNQALKAYFICDHSMSQIVRDSTEEEFDETSFDSYWEVPETSPEHEKIAKLYSLR